MPATPPSTSPFAAFMEQQQGVDIFQSEILTKHANLTAIVACLAVNRQLRSIAKEVVYEDKLPSDPVAMMEVANNDVVGNLAVFTTAFESLNLEADAREKLLGHHFVTAAFLGHAHIMKFLKEQGAATTYECKDSRSNALHAACMNGHIDAVRYILDHCKESGPKVNNQDDYGNTALMYAGYYWIMDKSPQMISRLLAAGADPNISKEFLGYTPLHFAVFEGCENSVIRLLRAKADVSIAGSNGLTPILEGEIHNFGTSAAAH